MQKEFILLIISLLIISCGKSPSRSEPDSNIASEKEQKPDEKPSVKVYIENSGSMDGYVKGVTEFEQAVYNYLIDIQIADFADSIQLNYINSKIISQPADISSFIENLEPNIFQSRGGNRGATDIAQILQLLLSEHNDSSVSVFVSDCIFSPGRGKNAEQYLINQQITIKSIVAEQLKKEDMAIVIYQLTSQFSGYYYNHEDKATLISDRRPFYIWLLGKPEYLKDLYRKIPENKFKGSGVENVFSITSVNQNAPYAVRLGSGDFKLDKLHSKNQIVNAQKSTHRKNTGLFTFSVDADFSAFLLDENYWKDARHYQLNDKDFQLSVAHSPKNSHGYSTALNLSSPIIKQSDLSIRLLMQIPAWVERMNDDSDLDIHTDGSMHKTFGIKYLIGGIYEAYTRENDYYTELKISINK
ncbi:hypothetical protein FACS189413_15760 [Bacteroidia bacterium]|nr:hypothetical protein FACS189413_15760 [Bacteroidia bacterium]